MLKIEQRTSGTLSVVGDLFVISVFSQIYNMPFAHEKGI
jgi:hypothetical protein